MRAFDKGHPDLGKGVAICGITAGRDLAKSVLAWIDGADPATLQHLVGPESAA